MGTVVCGRRLFEVLIPRPTPIAGNGLLAVVPKSSNP